MGDDGRLTKNYYGLATMSNIDDVNRMKKAIWAIFFHKLSTDQTPQYSLSPGGEFS